MKKRILCLVLAVMLVLSMTACGSKTASAEAGASTGTAQSAAASAEAAAAPEAAPAEAAAPVEDAEPVEVTVPEAAEEAAPAETAAAPEAADSSAELAGSAAVSAGITLIHAEADDGATFLQVEAGKTATVSVVTEDEDTTVDHWEFNGVTLDTGDAKDITSIKLPLDEAGVLVAVLRPIKRVECTNCYVQLLNKSGYADGDAYFSLDFENDYENPVTGTTCEGGTISCCISADTPNGETVAYWLINGVKYWFEDEVTYFYVYNLDEATTYEPVLKAAPKATATPKPTATAAVHQHSLSIHYDANQHWYQCACGYTEGYGEHNFVESVGEYNVDGSVHNYVCTCSVCGYSYTQTIIY